MIIIIIIEIILMVIIIIIIEKAPMILYKINGNEKIEIDYNNYYQFNFIKIAEN